MNKYLLLTKTQLLEFVPKFMSRGKKATKAIGYGGFAVFGLIAAAFAGVYEYMFANMFALGGVLDTFPTFLATVTMFVIILTTIGTSRQMIFSFGKIDSALSLPVSNATVIAVRLTIIYLYNLFCSALLLLPGCVVYMVVGGFDALFLAVNIVTMLFIPMVPLVFAAVIGAVLAFMSARFRYANIVNTVFLFAFLIAWIAFCGALGFYSGSGEGGAQMSNITVVNPFSGMLTRAYSGNFLSLLLFAAISVGTFLLFCVVFSKFFKSLQAAFAARVGRVKYSYEKSSSSAFKALFHKERAKLVSSSAYMANALLGPLFVIIAAVALIIFKGRIVGLLETAVTELETEYSALLRLVGLIIPVALIYFGGMGTVSSCSISLEGRSFATLKSSPVSGKTVILAKLAFSSLVTVAPMAVASAVIAFSFGFAPLNIICIILTPTLYCYALSAYGLLLNLKKYRFDYSNETQIIKQSFSVFVTVMTTIGIAMLLGAATALVAIFAPGSVDIASLAILALMIVLASAMTAIMLTKGEKMYNRIEI